MRKAKVYLHAQLAVHLTQDEQDYTFAYAPVYLATALTLNGKKRRLRQVDFRQTAARAGIDEKVMTGMLTRFVKARAAWESFIDRSFLPAALQAQFHALLTQRFAQLDLV